MSSPIEKISKESCDNLLTDGIVRKMKDDHLLHEILERICDPAHIH